MESSKSYSLNKPTIIVISSVVPEPTSAGQILLYRHLNELDGWNITVIQNLKESRWQTKLIKRLKHTRFHRFSNDLEVIDRGHTWDGLLINCKTQHPAIVLTVAHGDGWLAAKRFAQQNRLPLVTIFHDWYPDCPSLHQPFRQVLDRLFQHLYQQSNLALCVSEGMQSALGSHPNSTVLYPIPAMLKERLTSKDQVEHNKNSSVLRVVYFGNLHEYGSMLGQLLEATKEHPSVQVQVRGAKPNWSADFRARMRDRGLWLDFAPRDELNDWLASADAFLVVMSFDPALRRRMKTSFPSKLPEYAQFGKPLAIWGPEYCSAIQWGIKGDRAVCVTERNPQALIASLENLQQSPDLLDRYSQQSKIAAQTEFNPIIMQSKFLQSIQPLVH